MLSRGEVRLELEQSPPWLCEAEAVGLSGELAQQTTKQSHSGDI